MISYASNSILHDKMTANKHTLFVISVDEMDKIVNTYNLASAKKLWKALKYKVALGVDYTALILDLKKLFILMIGVGALAKLYIKKYRDKAHIILKGSPKLRYLLKGTRYNVNNVKIIQLAIGSAGAMHAIKGGGILTLVLVTSFNIIDLLLSDGVTLFRFIGSLAIDIAKVGVAVGATIAGTSLVIGILPFVAGFVIGPLVVAIVISGIVADRLNFIDKQYSIKEKVIKFLEELEPKYKEANGQNLIGAFTKHSLDPDNFKNQKSIFYKVNNND